MDWQILQVRIHRQPEHETQHTDAQADHQQSGAGDTAQKNRLSEIGEFQLRFATLRKQRR